MAMRGRSLQPGTRDAHPVAMGMLLVLSVVIALALVVWLFLHAVREGDGGGGNQHGWLVVVPLVIMFGWIVEQLLTH
jgi:hypothetical protein